MCDRAERAGMANLLRLGGWALLGLILLWVVFEVMRIVLGFLSWVINTIISLLVVALVLYLIYLGVSKFVGGSSRESRI